MPEIRINPLTFEAVCFSESRAERPIYYQFESAVPTFGEKCPFCMNNIHLAADEIVRSECGNVRIIENKYPALSAEGNPADFGFHEVLIDTPEHNKRLPNFTAPELKTVFCLSQKYLFSKAKDSRINYISLFKNMGAAAGASISHSHWQIIGMNHLPFKIETMATVFATRPCPVCEENTKQELIIFENSDFVSVAPFASRFPFIVSVRPKEHLVFEKLSEHQIMLFSEVFSDAVKRLERLSPGLDLNVCFMNDFRNGIKHFFVEIIPRIGKLGGFELGSGNYINSIYPEIAAKRLKEV